MRKLRIILLICLVLSILVTSHAPNGFDKLFCTWIGWTSLIVGIIFISAISKKEGIFNAHSIFLFSYFCVNFVHVLFVYPDDSLFPTMASIPYSTTDISYCIGIAQIGMFSYMAGVTSVKQIRQQFIVQAGNVRIPSIANYICLIISCMILLYVLNNKTSTHLYPRLMVFILALHSAVFFIKIRFCNTLYDIYKNNKILIISYVIFILSQLYIGSRGEVLMAILFTTGIINREIKKINIVVILNGIVIGLIFMTIIMLTRMGAVNFKTGSIGDVLATGWELILESGNVVLLSLSDLIINSRNLYDGIHYAQTHTLLYGLSYIPCIFVFIPFGANIIMPMIWGVTPTDVNTAKILSGYVGADFGIGTNILGDIYMNFSFIGIIVIMFSLGLFVEKTRQSKNTYMQIAYYSILANSIFLTRACCVSWTDLCAFIIIFYFILCKSTKTYNAKHHKLYEQHQSINSCTNI